MATVMLIAFALGMLGSIPVAVLWSRRTIQRVRQLEARARTVERLAEMGTLTGGLAHEIKNPLSTVGLNLQLLQEDLAEVASHVQTPDDQDKLDRAQRRLDALHRETQRLKDILEDFLRFAGRMKLELTQTEVHALIRELADFYEPQANASGIRFRCQLSADPPTAPVDASLLKQALLNLLINATQAMADARQKNTPHGGANELIIRTENAEHLGAQELRIDVIDTGPGIPPDALAKVFQPYFSTKRGGTGLGLPTARRIIDEHGGRLTVHSELGRGTDFTIALPMQPAVS